MLATIVSSLSHAQTPADTTSTDSTRQVASTEAAPSKHPRLKKIKTKVKHTGSIFYRFLKSFDDYDTTYISPNYYNYTAMLQNTNTLQVYRLQGKDTDGHVQTLTAHPQHRIKFGPYFGWRWIFLGYTFDVVHPKSIGKSSSFNFSIYSSMLGCDFLYYHNEGNYMLRKAIGFEGVEPTSVRGTHFSGLSTNTLSLNVYYVFNHRHFSYPAAYNQSTVQRKSCGSGIVGLGFSKQHSQFDYTRLPASLIGTADDEKIIEQLKFSGINYTYYYASGGYAYNWVFARNWLLGGSFTTSLGYRKTKGQKVKGNEILLDLKNFSFDCTSRLGLVWNNAHWFAGASAICNLYVYNKNRLSSANAISYINVYAGFFFNRKKQYRKQ